MEHSPSCGPVFLYHCFSVSRAQRVMLHAHIAAPHIRTLTYSGTCFCVCMCFLDLDSIAASEDLEENGQEQDEDLQLAVDEKR